MKKFFENPEVEVVKFSAEDVITTSGIELLPEDTEGMAGLN